MNESLFKQLVLAWIALAVILFPILLKVKAPYGRHTSKKWGLLMNNRAGWILMELPSLILFATLALTGTLYGKLWLFFGVWILHYTNRIFVYPLRTKTRGKKIPLLIVLLATFFNLVNGFVNGYWLGHLEGSLEQGAGSTEIDPALIAGIILFAGGFLLNQVADSHLISLRKGKQGGYFIPFHPVFKLSLIHI
jgi:3-oxo-5-alpha-steroid 4-dehydrogenase 1